MPSMAIDGAEITSDVLPAMPRPFFGGARGSRRAEPRRRSPAPAGLHLLPQARRRPRAALRRLLGQNRFHRSSALLKARRASALRYRRAFTFGRGNRRSASLRPGAGCGALFLDHARPDPELQIWGSPRGRAPVRAVDGGGGCRAPRRCRNHRAGSALPVEALLAAFQPVGHARPGGRQTDRRSRRLLPAREGQAHSEPGWAHRGTAAQERRRGVPGDGGEGRVAGEAHRRGRRDHHRCHRRGLRQGAEAGWCGAGRHSRARQGRGTFGAPAIFWNFLAAPLTYATKQGRMAEAAELR